MSRLRQICIALLLLIAGSGVATAAPVEGYATFESVRVPLPPGTWEVIDSVTIPNPRFPNFPITQQILVSRSGKDGKVVDRVVRIWVQRKKQLADYFTPYRLCENGGYLHAEVKENSGDTLDCWHIRPMSLGRAGEIEPGNKLLTEYAKKNGLFLPVVMLGARFARKPNNNLRYTVEYLWTPDLLLPAGTKAKIWTPADWTVEAVKADPAKQAVIQPMIDWATDWHSRIK